jgi:hypothetical protein
MKNHFGAMGGTYRLKIDKARGYSHTLTYFCFKHLGFSDVVVFSVPSPTSGGTMEDKVQYRLIPVNSINAACVRGIWQNFRISSSPV